MFDRVASRYDRLNRIISFGQDCAWRRRVAELLPPRPDLNVLDLATGTGDQLLALLAGGRVSRATGLDPSENMLAIARKKTPEGVALQTGTAEAIPFPDAAFDAVTMSFGIRNVTDVDRALREIRRVLRPGGRAVILESSLPDRVLPRRLFFFYIRRVVPVLGSILARDRDAYTYLARTIATFPYGEAFCALMREAGFAEVRADPLALGAATVYVGTR
jgi:demethylmenaquinone methyltransferase / 2-methoxy-6-polyprenyl-1,4-benzoquinol methylase